MRFIAIETLPDNPLPEARNFYKVVDTKYDEVMCSGKGKKNQELIAKALNKYMQEEQ
jgi:hypothetical protein